MYDYRDKIPATRDEVIAMIDKRFVLPLTGRVVDGGTSPDGTYVQFKLDKRWGFGDGFTMKIDAACLEHECVCPSAPCDCNPDMFVVPLRGASS